MGLDGHCANHETHQIRENAAVIVRAFSPWIVESDVEMALVVGLRPTLVSTAPLTLWWLLGRLVRAGFEVDVTFQSHT
ncbi:MAG: hypothetical protein GX456_13495 [Verrucomicrobia bacterium]|nr:hypothetical protein [Verrucomicrobiota bacterium]